MLSEVLDAVKQAAYERLEAHRTTGGLLADLKMVVRGDRTVNAPKFPLCGVTGGVATPVEQTAFAIRWNYPLRLTVQVMDHEPTRGYAAAERLAAACMHAIWTDPATGQIDLTFRIGESVYHLAPGQFEPPARSQDDDALFQARAQVIVAARTTF